MFAVTRVYQLECRVQTVKTVAYINGETDVNNYVSYSNYVSYKQLDNNKTMFLHLQIEPYVWKQKL